MKRYFNRLIWDSVHKGLVKIFGEKGAYFAWGGFIVFAIIISAIVRLAR